MVLTFEFVAKTLIKIGSDEVVYALLYGVANLEFFPYWKFKKALLIYM